MLRAYVTDVGTYGAANTGAIVIENTSSAQVLANIGAGLGQTQLSMYTVPAGWTAYLKRLSFDVSSSQSAEVRLWQRQDADDVATPFTGKRLVHRINDLNGHHTYIFDSPPSFPAKTDIWAESKSSGGSGSEVEVQYDLLLTRDTPATVPQ